MTTSLSSLLRAIVATLAVFVPYGFIIFVTPDMWRAYPWIDIPFHIAGGIVASLWVLFFFSRIRHMLVHPHVFFLSVFIIGVGWECFEYILDLYTYTHWIGTFHDTAGDLVNDMIGAAITWAFFRNQR